MVCVGIPVWNLRLDRGYSGTVSQEKGVEMNDKAVRVGNILAIVMTVFYVIGLTDHFGLLRFL